MVMRLAFGGRRWQQDPRRGGYWAVAANPRFVWIWRLLPIDDRQKRELPREASNLRHSDDLSRVGLVFNVPPTVISSTRLAASVALR